MHISLLTPNMGHDDEDNNNNNNENNTNIDDSKN